jgi:flagellin
MYFHIGANMDQNLAVDIADMRADALGLIGTEPVEETEAGEVVTVAQVETTSTDVSDVTIAEDSSYEGTFTLSIEHDGTTGVNATLKNAADDVIASLEGISAGEITIGDFTLNVDTLPTATSENFDVILEVTQVDPATLEEAEVPSLETSVTNVGEPTGSIENVVVDVESGYGGDYTVRVDAINVTVIGPDGQQVGQGAVADIDADNTITIEGFTITFDGTQVDGDEFTITVTPAEVPEEGVVDESTMHGINVDTREAANEALSTIDEAISMVSEERSKLGAIQNRLEHTIANLGTSAENLQAAESRIRDLDMAEEIMAFTKNNILQQAATAMLAQANMAPQSVLQLLG